MVTTWDYADPKHYTHDEVSTDKRHPTVNANGLIFGSPEYSTDNVPYLDPVHSKAFVFHAPVRDKDMPYSLGPGYAADVRALAPSPYWGTEQIWDTHINNHNSMFDDQGPAVAGRRRARRQGSGFLRQEFRPAVGQALPAVCRATAS